MLSFPFPFSSSRPPPCSVAFGWMAYMGSRALFFSPECHLVNRKARCSTVRPEEVTKTGEQW